MKTINGEKESISSIARSLDKSRFVSRKKAYKLAKICIKSINKFNQKGKR